MTSTLPNKQPTIFLWKVKKDALWVHVLDSMYHAALNVSQRMDFEREQEQEVSVSVQLVFSFIALHTNHFCSNNFITTEFHQYIWNCKV